MIPDYRALCAEPEAEGPNDEEIISQADKFLAYSDAHMGDPARWEGSDVDLVAFTRHALARWGRHPAPPADGEVAELVEWLRTISKRFRLDQLGDEADQTDRAATLLERFASPACLVIDPGEEALALRMTARIVGPGRIKAMPAYMQIIEPAEHTLLVPVAQPVPLSERMPGPEDCDAGGCCWAWEENGDTWGLTPSKWLPKSWGSCTHWLPAHALPLPTPEATND